MKYMANIKKEKSKTWCTIQEECCLWLRWGSRVLFDPIVQCNAIEMHIHWFVCLSMKGQQIHCKWETLFHALSCTLKFSGCQKQEKYFDHIFAVVAWNMVMIWEIKSIWRKYTLNRNHCLYNHSAENQFATLLLFCRFHHEILDPSGNRKKTVNSTMKSMPNIYKRSAGANSAIEIENSSEICTEKVKFNFRCRKMRQNSLFHFFNSFLGEYC